VLFNADDTKAWQVLLGGYARQIPHYPTSQPSTTTASPTTSTGRANRPLASPSPPGGSYRHDTRKRP
jgi:hypothetical protein